MRQEMLCCLLQTLLRYGLTGPCSHPNSPFHPLFLCCSVSLLALQIVLMSPCLAFLPWTPTMTQGAPLSYKHHWSFVHSSITCFFLSSHCLPQHNSHSRLCLSYSSPWWLSVSILHEPCTHANYLKPATFLLSEFYTVWFWSCCRISLAGT